MYVQTGVLGGAFVVALAVAVLISTPVESVAVNVYVYDVFCVSPESCMGYWCKANCRDPRLTL